MSVYIPAMLTEGEYLAFERISEQKHEYYDGIIVAQAGGSAAHNRITMNALNSLYNQLINRPCTVYSSDMRVKVPRKNSYVYPDGVVVCGEERYDDTGDTTLLNPIVIIEVLSPSTERHDRGKKFEWYRTIESLEEYVLIAQETQRIDHFRRQSTSLWTFTSIGAEEAQLYLASIDCTLILNAIYHNI
ncbi:Uma2 family endonuclease [Candidatus Chloroploca sp. M-50]|uniref:Uma2 family endonuclease n=1 Tax=Candidatus Chloroploca mongolica TaxID=2528176 RepID=A0ABS4D4C6_9CHLR|nr:Uma2 family endonuclease [Candidatus Chloroploca mongolica]MBP1464284.1 Uma2 family endonuclease [Candidatus Chloroploca mongolica]